MMNKYSFNKRIVASILLLTHIGMSCSNHDIPGVDQNRPVDQTTTKLLKSASNSFNSKGQIATLTLVAEEEEACQGFSLEADDKKPDYQESAHVHLTLDKENFSRIEKLDASKVSLPRHINNNNEQSRNQELVSPSSASLSHEVKDAEDFIQSLQASIRKGQSGLQAEANQEAATDTQLVEAILIDQMEGQQADNHTLSIQSLQNLTDLEEEFNEGTATYAEEYERRQQANRNIMLAVQRQINSHVCTATFCGVLGTVLLTIGGGILSLMLKQGFDYMVFEVFIIFTGFVCVITSIILVKRLFYS